jgi:hypothetical protein
MKMVLSPQHSINALSIIKMDKWENRDGYW